ncbi:hypothetical protein Tco_1556994 [Tanacetum coccineum]
MANLEFCDKHNMVAYLMKPTGSEGFQEIVDFPNRSHIRYALSTNPTIYVSLIEKFWQTATVRTVDNREQEITATVDGKEFIITKASVRRHLQLADADGISVLPNTKIFDQLSLMGQALEEVTELPQTSEPIPNVADEAVYREWDDSVERATTTAASLDAEQASGNILKTQSTVMPNVPLPQGIGTGGSPRCQEATGVPLLRLDNEEDLEDTSKQERMIEDIDQDVGITLVTPTKDSSQEDQPEYQLGVLSAAKVLADAVKKNVNTYTRRRRAVSTGSEGVSTASRLFSTAEESVSTAGASMPVSTAGMV